jgi:tripartite-type tricarboxylate transporter receptor subunit TctC
VVVPFPAGGGGDNLARLVLARLGPELGQSIVFENIGGAGGNVGVASVTRAAADGYTLSYGTNGTHAINQTLYKNPGFDALKNFEPLGRQRHHLPPGGGNSQGAGRCVCGPYSLSWRRGGHG